MIKRGLDILVGGGLLLLLSPVLALTALLVRVTSPGPVVLAQWRLGLYGVPFQMYKFRSMCAETTDGLAHGRGEVTGSDPRLTPIGGIIRAWRLDELPQLWHVLSGDMSLVGARPEILPNLEFYTPQQLMRFAMPQGCCTWGFVRGAFENDWSARQDINVEYVEQWSLWLDLEILVKSLYVLLLQRNVNPTENALPRAANLVEDKQG